MTLQPAWSMMNPQPMNVPGFEVESYSTMPTFCQLSHPHEDSESYFTVGFIVCSQVHGFNANLVRQYNYFVTSETATVTLLTFDRLTDLNVENPELARDVFFNIIHKYIVDLQAQARKLVSSPTLVLECVWLFCIVSSYLLLRVSKLSRKKNEKTRYQYEGVRSRCAMSILAFIRRLQPNWSSVPLYLIVFL